jgi:hypothetical protein
MPVEAPLSILHVNAHSLSPAKFAFVMNLVAQFEVDILCVSETWFTPNSEPSESHLKDFITFRSDRVGRVGGGVAVTKICYQARWPSPSSPTRNP